MSADRPFPPTARRLALARAAGLTPASPLVVSAAALTAAAIALAATGGALATRLASWLRDAIASADGQAVAVRGGADIRAIVSALVALALPVLGAVALAAIGAHLAQTRAVWLPRRRIDGAPAEPAQRGLRAALALANATVIGGVTVGWLFTMAPRLAALPRVPLVAAQLVVSFLAALAVAWIALGVVDALVRFAATTAALRMTHEEQRADARLAGADPRWRARREKLAREDSALSARDAVAGAAVLVLGDGLAIAIAWDAVRRPIPVRTAVGRGARHTQLLALARRHSVAIHRDPILAAHLATGDGPVPEAHWPALATVVAAVRR